MGGVSLPCLPNPGHNPSMTTFDWRKYLPVHPAADLLPRMSESELRELAEDIAKNGLQQSIDFRSHDGIDELIDGRNRLDALALLGWLGPKSKNPIARAPLTIRDKRNGRNVSATHLFTHRHLHSDNDVQSYVISANVHRRHLTAEQKRDLIATLLKAQPESSDRQIAKTVKVSHHTVGDVRTKLEATGQIAQLDKTVGADGKARKKPIPWQKRINSDLNYEAYNRGTTVTALIEGREPTELEVLRLRAGKLGYKVRKRGDSYGLIPTNGECGESWGPIETMPSILDGMEGKRAWQGYTACGMVLDGWNNSEVWLAAHPGATMEDFEKALPPAPTGCDIDPGSNIGDRAPLQPSTDADASAAPPIKVESICAIDRCLEQIQFSLSAAISDLKDNDPQALDLLFDKIEGCITRTRADTKRKLAAEIVVEWQEVA